MLKILKTPSPRRPSTLPRAGHEGAKKVLKAFFSALLLIALTSYNVHAEEWKPSDPDTSLGHFPDKIGADLSHLFSLDSLPPLFIGGIGAAFDWGAYDSQDALAPRLIQLHLQPLFDVGNFYGEGWVEGGAALGSWSLGSVTGDPRLQQFGRDAAESLLLSTVLVTGVKYAVNRTRPDGGNHSFPSGHSITAFCFAPVVQKYGGWALGVPAYALATLTTFARVEGYHHYLSDVIAGAALGIIVGNAVVYEPKDISVSAGLGGVRAKWTFN